MIANDNVLFRKGLISLIAENKRIKVTGEVSIIKEMLGMMRVECPNVALLDLNISVFNETKVDQDPQTISSNKNYIIKYTLRS